MEEAPPPVIRTVEALEERLSRPTPGVVRALRDLPGDIAVLGVGGKMGPTLARMARRALDELGRRDRVIGVSRFRTPELPDRLRAVGIEPVACDLLDRDAVARLPDAAHVVFMAGQKFGTNQGPESTWAMNTLVPALAAERYSRSRIAAFSTGCVYAYAPVGSGGSREEDDLGPPGDYANSCVGRERILTYCSRKNGTPLSILRLNYAVDLRYGVLVDIAAKVWRGEPVDVTMGYANAIWQQDANAYALQSLALAASPPFVLNITGAETLSIRSVAQRFGEWFGRPAVLTGSEAPTAWLNNASRAHALFGPPGVDAGRLMRWVAEWVRCGGETLGKPTHFEVRNGRF